MNSKLSKILQYVFFTALGLGLFLWLYKDQNLDGIADGLRQMHVGWLVLTLFTGLLSHVARAVRWRMMITPLGYTPTHANAFMAVMIMYLANLAVPRSGELSRCGVISRYYDKPMAPLLGTVVAERILDMIFLLICTVLVVVFAHDVVLEFLGRHPSVAGKLAALQEVMWSVYGVLIVLVGIVFMLAAWWAARKWLRGKLRALVDGFSGGMQSVRQIGNPLAFWALSVLIWVLYFLVIYFCFKAFPATENLGMVAGFAVLVMGSYGMVAPVQGGIGPWHFMVIETLIIYGQEPAQAQIFALIAHGLMTLVLLVAGAGSAIALPFYNSGKKSDVIA